MGAAADERARRGDLASAGTRMALRPERLYLAGTAKYRARATKEEAQRRLLGRGTRTRIEHAAEIGPRLHENLQLYGRWRVGANGNEGMATADGGNFI